jgi:hypothetical protein
MTTNNEKYKLIRLGFFGIFGIFWLLNYATKNPQSFDFVKKLLEIL